MDYVDEAVGSGINLATALTHEALLINGAYTVVGPVTGVKPILAADGIGVFSRATR
jgi:hypothetical protein